MGHALSLQQHDSTDQAGDSRTCASLKPEQRGTASDMFGWHAAITTEPSTSPGELAASMSNSEDEKAKHHV